MNSHALRMLFAGAIAITLAGTSANATVITSGYVDITGFSISIGGTGSVLWDGDGWSSEALAYAADSLSSPSSDFADLVAAFSNPVSASAATSFASADSNVTFDSSSLPLLHAGGATNLPDPNTGNATADSSASSNSLVSITGGTGSVDVTFTLNFTMSLSGSADANGVFYSETGYAGLTIFDPNNYYTAFTPPADFLDNIVGGPNSSANHLFSSSVSQTYTLNYDSLYSIFLFASDEHYVENAVVPEPSTYMLLISLGMGAVLSRVRRKPLTSS